jgi:Fe-S oxidoreductase/nitrate reductase gamma subunit
MPRIPYWNIDYGIIIDLLAIPVAIVFFYGLYRQWLLIKQGKMRVIPSIDNMIQGIGTFRLKAFLVRGILNARLYRKPASGIAHGFVFWGMVILFIGTTLVILNILFGLPVFSGGFNRWFMSFMLDLAGFLALVGIVFFLVRRMIPPDRLRLPEARKGFVPVSGLLGLILITGFITEGARIAAAAGSPEAGAFVGNFLASNLISPALSLEIHAVTWWVHGLLSLGFVAYIPYSPLVHIVLAPVNVGFADPAPNVKMGVMDFSAFENEDAEDLPALGAGQLADFTRKRFLDFSSCLWCGRCQEVCPAYNTDKPLSPKGVIVTLAERLASGKLDESLIDGISMDAIFNCTTCAACMEVCPVSINQPKTIMRFRQNLVMEQSRIPELMGKAVASLEQRGHPFFGTGSGAAEWRKDLDVPIFEPGQTEYLLWIGCSVTYEQRAQKIGRAMVRILQKTGTSFGILEESRCTGDPAKQMGNEFLFAEIAQQNIEDFSALGIKKIITLCPHCFNSFSRHYPKLGGEYEIIPHSSFIKILMDEKKLNLVRNDQLITYHDPCYLGRRNGIYDDPRTVIAGVGGLVEMPRHRNESFCCGGGGGNYWAEELGSRINQQRAGEALETNADTIAVACPFCLLMLTDGLKKHTEETKIFDIAEIVAASMV